MFYLVLPFLHTSSVYPTLDTSDTEEDKVFKARGRPKRDETWNPKGKAEIKRALSFNTGDWMHLTRVT